jgi:hypothetical protein
MSLAKIEQVKKDKAKAYFEKTSLNEKKRN